MIGQMNNGNPYIIMLKENMNNLRLISLQCTNVFTGRLISVFLVNAILSAVFFSWHLLISHLILSFIYGIVTFIELRRHISRNPLNEITRIIYGNQYEKIYVNNEKLLQIIQDMSAYEASINSFIRSIKFTSIFAIVSMVLLTIVSKLF